MFRLLYKMKSVIFIRLVSSLHLFDSGVLLERKGNLYLSHDHVKYNVHVNRPLPLEQIEKLTFADCSNCSEDTPHPVVCQQYAQIKFHALVRKYYQNKITELERDANNLGYRTRRSLFGLLGGLANFGWNTFQEKEIKDLKHITLQNADSSSQLADGITENQQAISVLNKSLYKNLQNLDQQICQNSIHQWERIMNNQAENIITHFLTEIEEEVISIIEGSLPHKMEYMNLYRGLCLKSCSEIEAIQCAEYCSRMISHLPIEMTPQFSLLTIHEGGVIITFEAKLPRLTLPPEQLFTSRVFGIPVQTEQGLVKRMPSISKYVASFSNETFLEIEDRHCKIGRNDIVCEYAAVKVDSCLEDIQNCAFTWRPTHSSCTHMYTNNGVAVYALEKASVKNALSFREVGNVRTEWSGLRFIPSEDDDLEIHCGNKRVIDLPSQAIPVNINVTIISYVPVMENVTFAHANIHPVQLEFNQNFENIKHNQKQAHETISRNNWIIIAALITTFLLGIIITIVMTKKVKSQKTDLLRELERIKPVFS